MAKMWAGRFQKEADKRLDDFNSSIPFDQRMYRQDLTGSMAHVTMLAARKIIQQSEADAIVASLGEILAEIESGTLAIDMTAEDIHMFVEAELTKRLGDTGKRMHTARARNDQVALDVRLYVRDEIKTIEGMLKELVKVLCAKAEENLYTVMPGYTHMQRAQPVTFAHHMMAYVNMLLRDIDRLQCAYRRTNVMPLGNGALAGTTYPIDRQMVCDLLHFDSVTQNSIDGVSDRDFAIDTVAALAQLMMHLSRFCEEILLWCSWEFKFIELDDAFATGSSMMPQKKNPDIAELVRGKTGRVYGDLIALLTIMKGLALSYNKDMQEDKEAIFDAVDTAKMCLEAFTPMIDTAVVLKDNMRAAAAKGFINATDCADFLVKRGLPFRDAYKVTGTLVGYCIQNGYTLETLPLENYKEQNELFTDEIYASIALEKCCFDRKLVGGPAPETVAAHIADVKKLMI